MVIGTRKKEYATKIKVSFKYHGINKEKEISFRNFSVRDKYVSFYIEEENMKYLIPWDKINEISISYR